MKRLLLVLALVMLIMPAAPLAGHVDAVDVVPVCTSGNASGTDASGTDVCKDVNSQSSTSPDPIITIIKGGINILSIVIGAAAIIGILASSIRMITSGGDTNAAASARSGLIYSLVGVAIAVLAQAIVAFVLNNVS